MNLDQTGLLLEREETLHERTVIAGCEGVIKFLRRITDEQCMERTVLECLSHMAQPSADLGPLSVTDLSIKAGLVLPGNVTPLPTP